MGYIWVLYGYTGLFLLVSLLVYGYSGWVGVCAFFSICDLKCSLFVYPSRYGRYLDTLCDVGLGWGVLFARNIESRLHAISYVSVLISLEILSLVWGSLVISCQDYL